MTETSNFYEAKIDKRTVMFKKNAEQEKQIYDKLMQDELSSEAKLQAERLRLQEKTRKQIAEAEARGNQKRAEELQAILARSVKQSTDYELQVKARAAEISRKRDENNYRAMSLAKKRELAKQAAEELALEKKKAEALRETQSGGKKAATTRKIKAIDAQIKQAQTDANTFSPLELALDKNARKQKRENVAAQSKEAVEEKAAERAAAIADHETKRQAAIEKAREIDKKYEDQLRAAKAANNKEEIDNINAAKKTELEGSKEILEAEAAKHELEKTNLDFMKAGLKDLGNDIKDSLGKAVGRAVEKTSNALDANLDAMFGQQGRMMGRLQGTAINWKKTVDSVSDTIGLSGVVSKKSVVNRMVQLVDEGVAYNLEMRAFLAETSENIASTFSATNGTLLRMIRLQQSDTTAARLGMEASLTKLFNDFFQDSSYLAKDVSDSVATAIMDASATRNKNESLEFEYAVQKWLGSLYSLGMSEQAVNQIATGINYLGTGNVGALGQNDTLQTLLAMSASRAGGKSYSDMLMSGLTADDTNNLLKAMVEYLAEIAEGQSNYVTKSAYADLFGMSITDLTTFASLTATDIDNLYKRTVNYNSLWEETQNQLNQISSRLNISQLITNAIDNAEVGAAANIGSNAFTYGTWKALSLLKDYVGEVKLPSILAMGSGFSADIDLLNVAQTGLVGMGLLGSLLEGVGSMFAGGATKLSRWGFDEYTTRGGGLSLLDTSATQGTSYSAALGVGSTSGEDISNTSLSSAKDRAEETKSEEAQEQADYLKDLHDSVGKDSGQTILEILTDIDNRLDPNRVFYTAMVGVLSSDAAKKLTDVSAKVETAKDTLSMTTSSETITNTALKVAERATSSSNWLSGSTSGGPLSESDSRLQAIITEAIRVALTEAFPFTTLDIAKNTGGMF